MTRRLAALDVGSNTVHLLVADADAAGRLLDVAHDLTMPRIGRAVGATGEVGKAKLAEVTADVARFAARARELGADTLLLGATEAVRRARDADLVLAAVGEAAGVPCVLISSGAEARLSFRGATSRPDAPSGAALVADIGGASTECILGEDGRIDALASVPVGSGVATDRWLASDPPTDDELAACAAGVRVLLEQAPEGAPAAGTAVGGTATTLPLVLDRPEGDGVLDGVDIDELRRRLGELGSTALAARHGVDPARARVLPGGLEVLAAVLERYGLDRVTVSHRGLRHGMMLAHLERGDGWPEG